MTRCGVIGGTLRGEAGDLNFSAGGVLRPDDTLEPGVQATIDTLREGSRLGSAAIATITYEGSRMLCGHTLDSFVTAASLKAVPTPTPTPRPTPTPVPTPQPITRTATGFISRMSPVGEFVFGATGSCKMWRGFLKTDAGPSLEFAVQTPMIGNLETGLNPADPGAAVQARMLQRAAFYRARAPVTMTYTAPANVCGFQPDAVVTAATVRFPSPYDTKPKVTRRGRVRKLSAPSVITRIRRVVPDLARLVQDQSVSRCPSSSRRR